MRDVAAYAAMVWILPAVATVITISISVEFYRRTRRAAAQQRLDDHGFPQMRDAAGAQLDDRSLFDHAYDAIVILDPDDETILDANDRACAMYGLPREEFVGRSMITLSVDPARGRQLVDQTREANSQYRTFESRQKRGDGTMMDVEINAAEMVYKNRRVIISINRDISLRRKAEQAVRESEERFRLLLESVTDYAITMLDAEGRVVSWNAGAERVTGYTAEEIVGRPASQFAPPEEREELRADRAAAAATGRVERQVTRIRKDGTRFVAAETLTRIIDDSGALRGFALIIHDISERLELERSRAEVVAVLRDVASEWTETFDAVDVPIVLLDEEGRIRRLNHAAQKLAGKVFVEVLHRLASDFEGEPWQSIGAIARHAFEHGSGQSVRASDDHSVWQISCSLAGPLSDRRAIVIAYDLTLVTQLEASLRRSEVAATLGATVAAVAHEVRNPLFTMSATLDAWAARYGDSEGMTRYAGVLQEQMARLNRLMTDLLEYGKPTPLQLREQSLDDVLRAAAADCSVAAAQQSVIIELDIDAALPHAIVDPARVEQVFQNVIDNAIRHSPAGGIVRVEARTESDAIACRVVDEGKGVSAEDMAQAFVPFYTRRRGGTGLGLAIAHRIVTAHEGEIAIGNRSETRGAVVTIRLPRAAAESGLGSHARAC